MIIDQTKVSFVSETPATKQNEKVTIVFDFATKMSSNRSSRDYSSKRNPLVRSLRAKSNSSTGSSSHRKKSENHPTFHLDADQLDDEREAKEGLTPITLTRWILSQGKSYGSVYLLPFVRQGEEESGQTPSGYRYSIVGTNQPSGEKHFYTLR